MTSSKSPAKGTLKAVTMEALVPPFSVAAENNMTSQTAQCKNQAMRTESAELAESTEEWQACKTNEVATKAAKDVVKVAAKTSQQVQPDQAGDNMATSVSMGATAIDCEMGSSTWTAFPMFVPVYSAKGNTVGMSQIPVTPLAYQQCWIY